MVRTNDVISRKMLGVIYTCLFRRNGTDCQQVETSSLKIHFRSEMITTILRKTTDGNLPTEPNGTKICLSFGNVPSIAFRFVPFCRKTQKHRPGKKIFRPSDVAVPPANLLDNGNYFWASTKWIIIYEHYFRDFFAAILQLKLEHFLRFLRKIRNQEKRAAALANKKSQFICPNILKF
uniref:Uncharacterized protein n=1 Tax=Romanomermis culicivorax TaxID=13658 RepID=A0A915KLI3_ROMCU